MRRLPLESWWPTGSPRDFRLGVNEVLKVSLPSARPLVIGKYLGSLLAVLTPPLLLMLALVIFLALRLQMGALFWIVPLITLGTVLPAWLFFVAWSLFFPLALPLRLYQVLFAGFWMWAVAVPPDRLPTINESLLGVQGDYADHAFFNRYRGDVRPLSSPRHAWAGLS